MTKTKILLLTLGILLLLFASVYGYIYWSVSNMMPTGFELQDYHRTSTTSSLVYSRFNGPSNYGNASKVDVYEDGTVVTYFDKPRQYSISQSQIQDYRDYLQTSGLINKQSIDCAEGILGPWLKITIFDGQAKKEFIHPYKCSQEFGKIREILTLSEFDEL